MSLKQEHPASVKLWLLGSVIYSHSNYLNNFLTHGADDTKQDSQVVGL